METQEATFLYLKPGGNKFSSESIHNPPPIAPGLVRVVCISDTHNEQRHLNLPWGHLLVHAGDVMTESGLRYVKRSSNSLFVEVNKSGIALLEKFGVWFGSLPHPHKVVIGGNHDWVMQAIGSTQVTKILEKYSPPGRVVYLEHDEASVGNVKVFGSPYAHWGGHNDAFMSHQTNYNAITKNTHIVVTHYPAILPKSDGRLREDADIVNALNRVGALLHVGGHCHWANGLYHTKKGGIPCVVASVCDSHWLDPVNLFINGSGERGDSEGDRFRGGYNIFFPPIVCDLAIPGGPPAADDVWITNMNHISPDFALPYVNVDVVKCKPSLIFFGPSTDPSAVKRLLPSFSVKFNVHHFDDVEEAIAAVRTKNPYVACVAKLGSKGNLGVNLMKALREVYGDTTFIAVHSETAMNNKDTMNRLEKSVAVNLFVSKSSENKLLEELEKVAERWYLKNM